MPRKSKPDVPGEYGDKHSPSLVASHASKTARPGVAKVIKKTSTRAKPPATKKPPAKNTKGGPGKAASATVRRSPQPEGSYLVKNPVDLNAEEVEALKLGALHGLDSRQALFCDLWLVSYNATQSYRDAGYRCKNNNVASVGASKLLSKLKHHPYMLARQAELFKRTADIQNEIIAVVRAAAFADPRELVEYVRRCCRRCYGKDFKYQFRPSEMEKRRAEYDAEKAAAKEGQILEPFDELGGLGFDATKPPHLSCPECDGIGIGRPLFKDTGNLTPAALALYEGVKEGKDGTEIRIASQKSYRELLAKIFDLQVEPQVTVNVGVSKEELDETLAKAEANTEAQRQEMEERQQMLSSLSEPANTGV